MNWAVSSSPTRKLITILLLGLLSGGTMAVASAATSPSILATAVSATPDPQRIMTPESFGAVGDGTVDDTAALQRALNSLTPQDVLVFVRGRTYRHTAVLHVVSAGSHLSGPGTLLATSEATSSVWIDADYVTVDGGLVLMMGPTTQRWTAPEQHKLTLNGHKGAVISNVTIEGSAGAGVYIAGADHYLVQDVTVENTRADGIHNTGRSHDGRIVRPIIRNPGDDGVAVVSYQNDGGLCHDIDIDSPRFYSSAHGRAFSVVGGANITYRDVFATGSAAAGVYIAAEKSFSTLGVSNIAVLGGELDNSNQDLSVDHGAVLVTTDGTGLTNSDIRIQDLKIVDTRPTADRQVGVLATGQGANLHVQLLRFAITGGPEKIVKTDAAPSQINMVGWTFNGVAVPDHVGFLSS